MGIRIFWLLPLLLIVLGSVAQTPADSSRIDPLVKRGSYYLFKPGEFKTDLDSAMDFFQKALRLSRGLHTRTREMEILKLIGDVYLEGGDIPNGKIYIRQVTDYYHRIGDVWQEAEAWRWLSNCIRFEKGNSNAEKLRAIDRARPLFLQAGDSAASYRLLSRVAMVHSMDRDFVQAEADMKQMIAGYTALHYAHPDSAYDQLAEVYRQQGNLEKAIVYRLEAVRVIEAVGDTAAAATAYHRLSATYADAGQEEKSLLYLKKEKTRLFHERVSGYYQAGNLKQAAKGLVETGDALTNHFSRAIDEKLLCYDSARRLYVRLHDTLNEAEILMKMADCYIQQGKPVPAEHASLLAIEEFKSVHHTKLHPCYRKLAQAYRLEGNIYQELYYYIESAKNMEATADMSDAYAQYLSIASTYQTLSLPEKSLYYERLAWQLVQKNPADFGYYAPASRIVTRLIALKRKEEALDFIQKAVAAHPPQGLFQKGNVYMAFGNCYNALGDYAKAEYNYVKMIKTGDTLQLLKEDLFENYITKFRIIISFYLEHNQFARGSFYLHKLPDLTGLHISPVTISKLHYFRYRVDSASGNYRAAMEELALNKKLDDSIFNASKAQQINDLNIRYETSKKQDSIQLQAKDIKLLKNEEQLQAGRVHQSIFTRNILIAGSGLLLLLLGVLFNRYRLKQRSNRLLEAQKQEISTKNVRLENLLHDNEWLLREVHHRVKNNLQLVMSLLNSQSTYLHDAAALDAVAESKHRVQSMSLIHQKLYKTNNVSSIYMPEYIRDMVDYLKSSFNIGAAVYFDLQVGRIDLDVLHAIPVGLILNEAITNSLKYAFTEAGEHTIFVGLSRGEGDEVRLVISDNGRGLPDGYDISASNSFGMILMQGLTEDLGGRFEIRSGPGTEVRVRFDGERGHK